jgi:hypothetical protein
MIVWTGWGILVLVITFGFTLAGNFLTNSISGGAAYWDAHKWPVALALLPAAVVLWLLGQFLHNRNPRVLIDPKTGAQVVLRKSHALFFIPMHWWAPILVAGAIVCFAMEFLK